MMAETTTTTLPRFGHTLTTQYRQAFGYRYHCRCGATGKYKKTEALTKRGADAHLRAFKVTAQSKSKEA